MTSKRFWLWLVPALLWLLFFIWYTSFSGPLSTAEQRHYRERFLARAAGPDPEALARLERFMAADDGAQFIMVNNIDLAKDPPTLPATGPGAAAGELMDHYMAYMFPAMLARASHPVFVGTGLGDALDLAGIPDAEHWEQAALVRYRSRRDLLEIATDPRFSGRHDYKTAALTKTIAYPVAPVFQLLDARLLLALVLLAAVALVDLALYRRGGGR